MFTVCGTAFGQATPSEPPRAHLTLAQARSLHQTKVKDEERSDAPIDQPPAGVFDLVKYPSPVGPLSAYITSDPHDSRKRPAIIWITGGDCNTIGDVWSAEPPDNDQSAAAYRDAGIVMMFPALRGGHQQPGRREGFYGELDDILAAADFLAKQSQVDPNRIYLGGHSSGGTMVLLEAEYSDRFRAVFSFGPVAIITNYRNSRLQLPFDLSDKIEVALRSPDRWLPSIQGPTFVFEGDQTPSNSKSVKFMMKLKAPHSVHFYLVHGATHFTILAPTNRLIAQKILQDTDATSNIEFSDSEIEGLMKQ
jgi:dipeptidyl aminopeptidase/acylaminoacyl peptidase